MREALGYFVAAKLCFDSAEKGLSEFELMVFLAVLMTNASSNLGGGRKQHRLDGAPPGLGPDPARAEDLLLSRGLPVGSKKYRKACKTQRRISKVIVESMTLEWCKRVQSLLSLIIVAQ